MGPLNKLAALLGGSQPQQMPQQQANPAMLGDGMARQAAAILQSRPYQLHVQEAKAMGMEPMSPQQFLAMMQQRGV